MSDLEPAPLCPRCRVPVQPTWDWCEHCGFHPDAVVAVEDAPPPGPPRPPPAPPPLGLGASSDPYVPPTTFGAGPSERRTAGSEPPVKPVVWIVLGLVLIGGVLATVLVLQSRSSPRTRTDSAASSSHLPTDPTTTVDPKPSLGQQFQTITAASIPASEAYAAACGCPDHFNAANAIAALPALITAEQDEAAKLDALAADAPPYLASHILSLSHLDSQIVHDAQQLQYYAGTMSPESLTFAFRGFDAHRAEAEAMAQTVRADLGIGTGAPSGPAPTQTI